MQIGSLGFVDPPATSPAGAAGGQGDLLGELLAASPDAVVVADADGTVVFASPAVEQLFGYRPDELVGEPIEILMPEAVRAAHVGHRRRFAASPSARPMGAGLRLLGRRRDGTVFPIDVSLAPVDRPGAQMVGAFVRDATDTIRAQRRLQAVNELNQALLGGQLVSDILADVARHARLLLDARAAWVVAPSTDRDEPAVRVVAASGDDTDAVVGRVFPAASTLAGEAIASGQRTLVDDLSRSHWSNEIARTLDLGPTVVEPLAEADRSFGTLVVNRSHGEEPFTDLDIALLSGYAAAAAVGLKLGEVRAELEKLTMATEHQRIARDLHDTVIQRLFATGMSLQGVLNLVSGPAADRVARAVDDLDATITEIRTTIFGLRHSGDDTNSVRAQVLELVGESAVHLGFRPRVALDGPVDTAVTPGVADHLLPVVREALSNVARHAQATTAEVVVRAGEDVELTVLDDGVGPPSEPRAGSGLRNMAERAEALGGTFEVTPRPTGGTCLQWQVPNHR